MVRVAPELIYKLPIAKIPEPSVGWYGTPERIVTSGQDNVGTALPAQLPGVYQSVFTVPTHVLGFTIIKVLVVNSEHPPEAAIVYVMVYIPGAVAARSTAPFTGFTEAPAGDDEKVPPEVPVNVTEPVPIFEQYGVPL
jgi:hypothetical protein